MRSLAEALGVPSVPKEQGICAYCRARFEIPPLAVGLKTMFDRMLMDRGEEPLRVDEVAFCPKCSGMYHEYMGDNLVEERLKAVELAKDIRAGGRPSVPADLLAGPWGYIVREAWDLRDKERKGGVP